MIVSDKLKEYIEGKKNVFVLIRTESQKTQIKEKLFELGFSKVYEGSRSDLVCYINLLGKELVFISHPDYRKSYEGVSTYEHLTFEEAIINPMETFEKYMDILEER